MTRGLWTRETVAALLLAALLPPVLFWLWFGGAEAVARLSLALAVTLAWHGVFMLARAQPPSLSALVTALAVAMLMPEDLGAFRAALGLSFGVVMGELVFGGWGRNIVHPATVALSFLGFGFPAFGWPAFDLPVAWAAVPAALIGMALGVMPAGVLLGAAFVGTGAVLAGWAAEPVMVAGGVVLVLLVADPVTSAATPAGRWIGGALYAALVAVFAGHWTGAAPAQVAVSAALFTSLAVPLVDEAVLALWVARRRRRHGRT